MWRCFYCNCLNAEDSFECRCSAPRKSVREVLEDEAYPVICPAPYYIRSVSARPSHYYSEPSDSPDYIESTVIENVEVTHFESPFGKIWNRVKEILQ